MEQKSISLTILGVVAIIAIVGLVLLFKGVTGKVSVSPYSGAQNLYAGGATSSQCPAGTTYFPNKGSIELNYPFSPGLCNPLYGKSGSLGGYCCPTCTTQSSPLPGMKCQLLQTVQGTVYKCCL